MNQGYDTLTLIIIILGMFAVTYIPRVIPFFTAKNLENYTFLKYIPVAIFSSLAIPDVMFQNGSFSPEKTLAGVLAVLIAFKSRRMFITIALSVLFLYLLTSI
jgi:branched-subunit amino acid transport protein